MAVASAAVAVASAEDAVASAAASVLAGRALPDAVDCAWGWGCGGSGEDEFLAALWECG